MLKFLDSTACTDTCDYCPLLGTQECLEGCPDEWDDEEYDRIEEESDIEWYAFYPEDEEE